MANRFDPAQTSFNAGELSPMWAGRVDMAKYGNGCFKLRNYIPLPEGPVRRRGGTRFGAMTKTETDRSWGMPFIFSEDDSYVLEFGDGYIRFLTGDGQLLLSSTPDAWSNVTAYKVGDLVSRLGVNYYCKVAHTNQQPPNATYWHALTGDIYEIPSPYAIADLTNLDGTFRLDFEQTGDVIFIADGKHLPQKLSRFNSTRWTIADIDIKTGPFETQNPDQSVTVYASGETGTVTLSASEAIFTADMVGTLFLIESKRIDGYAVWEVAKSITAGNERRSDSNVYKALNTATTGTVKPTHREGAKFDGDTGVQWEYLHSGYGIVRIDSIGGGGTTATVHTVFSRIPTQAIGSGNATTRWARSSWRSDVGYPTLVKIFRERLCFARGQEVWGSVSGDFENFANRDGAETLPDSAFYITIGSGETNSAVWMAASDALLIGTRGAEFAVSEVTTTEVFGPGNIKSTEVTRYGARQVATIKVGGSILFAQRSGRRVRDLHPSQNMLSEYEATSLMMLSGHILAGQLVQFAFAQEPHSIAWGCCNNGAFVGLTYLLEQDVIGWHPHPIGGPGAAVESVVVIPAPDGTHDRVWLQVRRTVNGATRRYWEFIEKDWQADEQTLSAALFSDAGLTFDGSLPGATATITGGTTWAAGETATVNLNFTPVVGDIGDYLILAAANGDEAKIRVDSATDPANVTFITAVPASLQGVAAVSVRWARGVISGLDTHEGAEVTLTVDGAAHPPRTVTGGQITLQAPFSIAQIGFRADAEGETMRVEGGSGTGTAQGKIKRVHQLVMRLHESLGGKIGPAGEEDSFEYRSDGDRMDEPPLVLTGDFKQAYPEGYNADGRIRWLWDQPLPSTVVALFPRMNVEDAA